MSQMRNGLYMSPSKMTVAEWLTPWLEGRTGLAATTRDGYTRDIKRVTNKLGNQRLRDLNANLLSGFYGDLSATGLAPNTVKNTHAVLHKALGDAVQPGILSRNPADHVELPRVDSPETKTWTAEELSKFLRHATHHRLYAAFVLMCSTGMRRSEVLGVRWQNINLNAGTLAVVDTVVPIRNKPVFRIGETKSRGSRRMIGLDASTVNILREHKARQNSERLRTGESWSDLDLAFCNQLGATINPATFTRTTKRLAIEAKVPALTPHAAARHTWATLALSSGVHPKVVQERLGHSSISVTLDRYSHVTEGMDREAAEQVASLFH